MSFTDTPGGRLRNSGLVEVASHPSTQPGTSTSDKTPYPFYIGIINSDVVEVLRLPFTPKELSNTRELLGTNKLSIHECAAFGNHLFNFVFERSLRDLYRRESRHSDADPIRVTIATSVPELAQLPWELLCDIPHDQSLPEFLSHSFHVRLARSLRLFNRAFFQEVPLGDDSGLRILVVSASPSDTPQIDATTDYHIVQYLTDSRRSEGQIDVRICAEATARGIRRELKVFDPHIVHLACHADYDKNKQLGYVILTKEGSTKTADNVDAFRFATLLQEAKHLQLVIANTCHGAYQGDQLAFSGTAQCLHAVGIPCVISLQFGIEDRIAHDIVLNLYQNIICDQIAVEDAVTLMRRQMFIDGYPPAVTFGLTLYQGNSSLYWRPASTSGGDVSLALDGRFDVAPQKFRASLLADITKQLSQEHLPADGSPTDTLFEMIGRLKIEVTDLLEAYAVFGQYSIVLRLFKMISTSIYRDAKSSTATIRALLRSFLNTAKQAQRIALSRYEDKGMTETSLLLMTKDGLKDYRERGQLGPECTMDPEEQFGDSYDIAMDSVLKVDGTHKTFVTVFDHKTGASKTVIQKLTPLTPVNLGSLPFRRTTKQWQNVQQCIVDTGCAFVIPAAARVNLLMQDSQIAVFCEGSWSWASLRELSDTATIVAQESSINTRLMLDILEKCLILSEKRIGEAFIIERNTKILERYQIEPKTALGIAIDLTNRYVWDIPPDEYIRGVAGDGSVVISKEGYTLATNAHLSPSSKTSIAAIPGTGTRHTNAQKVTKETDAIACVVSQNGPITVFADGKPRVAYLRELNPTLLLADPNQS